jgi:phthalate 4,5-cis-dihydrodiol dehydrogenase
MGVIGLGRGFMLTAPALVATPGLRLAGAFDLRAAAREQFERTFGCTAYPTLEHLLADPHLSAIYVATPQELHATHAIEALHAGKHVLVEKPMATNVADGLRMVEAARKAGRILLVGPSHGFDAPVQRAAQLIGSGAFGAVRMVTAFNFTDYLYRPRRPEELDPRLGGGVVFSQGSHQIDVVRRLIGKPVLRVRATAGNWDPRRPGNGAYAAMIEFDGNAVATLTYSGYAHYDSDEMLGWVSELGHEKNPASYGEARRSLAGLTATGEALAKEARTLSGGAPLANSAPKHNEHFGFVLVSCERADLKITADGIHTYSDTERGFEATPPQQVARSTVMQEFVAAIRGRQAKRHDGSWGLATLQCCDALARSSATQMTIELGR